MGVTRLKRKARRNRNKAKSRLQAIKLSEAKPVIKRIDVEAIKEEFKRKPASTKVENEVPKAEIKEVTSKDVEVKTEGKKEDATKPAAKKIEKKTKPQEKKPTEKAVESKNKANKPATEKAQKAPAKKTVKKKVDTKK